MQFAMLGRSEIAITCLEYAMQTGLTISTAAGSPATYDISCPFAAASGGPTTEPEI
jgi:hypothetical protein